MNSYKHYMDRMEPSQELHSKLLDMGTARTAAGSPAQKDTGEKAHTRRKSFWLPAAALAACCALALGAAAWKLLPGLLPPPPPVAEQPPAATSAPQSPDPAVSTSGEPAATVTPPDSTVQPTGLPGTSPSGDSAVLSESPEPAQVDLSALSFTVGSPLEDILDGPPPMPYPELDEGTLVSAQPDSSLGSFSEPLTRQDILSVFWSLFWSTDKQAETSAVLADPAASAPVPATEEHTDVPDLLGWSGYTISGSATYSRDGVLTVVTIQGEQDSEAFTLQLASGSLPFSGCIVPTETVESHLRDTTVVGYCLGGEYVSRFMWGNVGIFFTSGDPELNDRLVYWTIVEGAPLCLDHLLHPEYLPFWEEAEYETLAEVRDAEPDFLPWIPAEFPCSSWSFYSRMTWQEDRQHTLMLRWSKGYDDVVLTIDLPEAGKTYQTVDPDCPESYDRRLYSKPYSETVPLEYWDSVVNTPCFRSQDMRIDLIEARVTQKDTGGSSYAFEVLSPDGILRTYRCSGLSVQEVWELVSQTLQ